MTGEVEELLKYNTAMFKGTSAGSKYRLELMNDSDPDCEVLRASLAPDHKAKRAFPFAKVTKHKKVNIYKVKPNETIAEGGSPRLLLNGSFGPGVYLTDRFETALAYGACHVSDGGVPKVMHYVFLNNLVVPSSTKRKLWKLHTKISGSYQAP